VTASSTDSLSTNQLQIIKLGGLTWRLSGLTATSSRQEIPLTYKVSKRLDNLEFKIQLQKRLENGESYIFWEKSIKPTVISSDLNLNLAVNGTKNDVALNFGQPLNYSLSYTNQGSASYKDVIIMAALDGDILDWTSLRDSNNGTVHNNTIIWTKNEIPALAEIKPGASGQLNFSLNLRSFKEGDSASGLTVTGYGQYNMNGQPVKGQENKSNIIKVLINSDLSLVEKIRYFNEDNQPVGSGPLPPKVGSQTSFRVYWTVKNNLHELTDAKVVFNLPDYVNFGTAGTTTNVGNLYFDVASHQVVWEIGRLPLSVGQVNAEFNISVTPVEVDRNKIIVLSSGSTVSAMDKETKSVISKHLGAKTSKLEDDDIANLNNSGIIQ
jgi:hypothetical protein